SVFIDTLLLCNATAFMCMVSGVEPTPEMAGAPYVQAALAASIGTGAEVLLVVCMALFAFTTLIGNLYYVENAFSYLLRRIPSSTFMTVYRILACLVIFLGSGMSMGLLWDVSDVNMGFMAIINIAVILILGGKAIRALDDYMRQCKEGKNPVFIAKNIGIDDKLDYWQE
ncbi:MAG: alanine:cation symporter family protein, partial [Acidaminococcaceae bacterium]|nr:alanine:cation symporter family protein [Acidaminococcaceae bacterium]